MINMRKIRSEEMEIQEFLENNDFNNVTLDIETMDSLNSLSNLRKEPIVSFSLSFITDRSNIISDFPTFAFTIEDVNEELDLLVLLKDIFKPLSKNITIVGHNIAYEVPCKIECGFQNTHGFDIPKILARCSHFNLDFNLLKSYKTYDSMNIAYSYIRHNEHKLLNRAGYPKKFLSSVELESFYNIKRPSKIPKLGSKVKEYFQNGNYKDIILYNCSDTIIESLFFKIFEHKLKVCQRDDGLISIKENCNHIPKEIEIEKMVTWNSLIKNA